MFNISRKRILLLYGTLLVLTISNGNTDEVISNDKIIQLLQQEITDGVEEKVKEYKVKLSELENKSKEYTDKITELESKLKELESSKDSNNSATQEQENKIKELTEEKIQLQNKIDELQKQIEEIKSNANNTDNQSVQELKDKIKSLEEEKETSSNTIQETTSNTDTQQLLDKVKELFSQKTNSNQNVTTGIYTNSNKMTENNSKILYENNISLIDFYKSQQRHNAEKSEKFKAMNNQTLIGLENNKSYYRSREIQIHDNNTNSNIKTLSIVDNNKSKDRNNNIWIKLSNNNKKNSKNNKS